MQDARGENQSRGRKLIFIYLFFLFSPCYTLPVGSCDGSDGLVEPVSAPEDSFQRRRRKEKEKKKKDPALRFRSRLYANVSPCTCEVCEACVSVWLRAGSASAAAAVWTRRGAAQGWLMPADYCRPAAAASL